jgi:hypothetical protein
MIAAKSSVTNYILTLLCCMLLGITGAAQEQPSVADAARKNRKGAPVPSTKKVYTNEDMAPSKASSPELSLPETPSNGKPSKMMSLTPEQVATVKEKIGKFKKYLASLETRCSEIKKWQDDHKNETAHCGAQQQAYGYSACDTIDEYQKELNDVERKMKSAQGELSTYQEKIRQMGYGSSVWDAS